MTVVPVEDLLSLFLLIVFVGRVVGCLEHSSLEPLVNSQRSAKDEVEALVFVADLLGGSALSLPPLPKESLASRWRSWSSLLRLAPIKIGL